MNLTAGGILNSIAIITAVIAVSFRSPRQKSDEANQKTKKDLKRFISHDSFRPHVALLRQVLFAVV